MAIERHLTRRLRKGLEQYPIVTLTGPRQSGKTTLARMALPGYEYVSLENPDDRRMALEDPRGFLDRFKGNLILDEAQNAPEVFSYLQGMVDADPRPGRFVLTGSQNFLLLQSVSQSLAGRCDILHLLPFSRSELAREPMEPIETIAARPPRVIGSGREALLDALWTGSYPRIHDQGLDPQIWLGNYYQTYIQRDVRDLTQIGDLETFERFMGLCAGRAGQLLNLSALGSDCGVSHATARRWLSILEASFIVMLLRPHNRSFNKRLVRTAKLYFLDTGLLCYLLRIRQAEGLAVHASKGSVFENWVVSEALKNYTHRGLRPEIGFWRDSSGHEIDLLLESSASRPVPVEAKAGQTYKGDFLRGLDWWRKTTDSPELAGVLVYGGETSAVHRGHKLLSWRSWG